MKTTECRATYNDEGKPMDKDLKHFTRPYRIGNIIILVLGGIFFVPLFLGLVGMALVHALEVIGGAR